MNNEAQTEGKWHNLLRQLRIQLRRGMDGETSTSQRKMGLEYGINFGVNLLRLKDIAKSIPHDEELAEIMWGKSVREMRLLSIMIRPIEQLSLPKALTLVLSTETLEEAEQLVFILLRHAPFSPELLKRLFANRYDPGSVPATIPYLLLNHLVRDEQFTPTLFEQLEEYIVADFCSNTFYSPSTIYHALTKLITERPELDTHKLLANVATNGTHTTRQMARQLQELAEEKE